MRSISCDIHPIRDHAFFEQAVLEGDLGQRFLELTGFGAQHLDLIGGRLAGGIAGETLLAGLQELLAPSVVEVLGDPFLRQSSAMLSSPRRTSRTMRILSSAEKCRRVACRMRDVHIGSNATTVWIGEIPRAQASSEHRHAVGRFSGERPRFLGTEGAAERGAPHR
jgi:hypothetical protein